MASVQQPLESGRKGFAGIFGGVALMGRKAQEIAGEFAKISVENIGAGNKAMDRLRDAKSLQDVTAIQTDMLKESYETVNAHCRKIAEIAASTPSELAAKYNELISAVAEAGSEASQNAADLARTATEKGADVVKRTTETMREAGRH